jgi:hypothetical protein
MASTSKTRKTTTVHKPAAKKTAASIARGKPARKSASPAPVRVTETIRITDVVSKTQKPKKPKLVRDSFTIPKGEYGVLQELKERAGRTGIAVKKSELLRAGIKALAAMGDAAFAGALAAVPTLKTGRPEKSQ